MALPVIARQARVDPAAWGDDHVGKAVPEYPAGDECLFCHRQGVGTSWARNAHNRTLRPVESDAEAVAPLRAALPGIAPEVAFVLGGGKRRLRYLKRAAAYGHLELLSTQWKPGIGTNQGRLIGEKDPHWNASRFGDDCAGCHATAVDPATRGFSAAAIDCAACHGSIDPKHSTDRKLAFLSPSRSEPARVVLSLCGSCHLRGGRSRSSGRPYPNNFVPGDNLFRDFRVNLDPENLRKMVPADRHVFENAREVAVLGRMQVTCLSCHSVHSGSRDKHRSLTWSSSCRTCHDGKRPPLAVKLNHSRTCMY